MSEADTIDAPWEETGRGLEDELGNQLADPDGEEALIGLLLLKPEALVEIDNSAGGAAFADNFQDPLLRRAFEVIHQSFTEDMAVSLPVVLERMNLKSTDPFGDMTAGQFFAGLVAQADPSQSALELAEHLVEVAERAADRAAREEEAIRGRLFTSTMGLKLWTDQNDPGQKYEYLVEDLIPAGEGVLIMGESGTGKSFLTQHLCMCGVRGVEFFGRRIAQRFGVVWLAFEAARGQTARMRAYRSYHGLDIEPLPFAALTKPITLWPDPEAAKKLVAELREIERVHFGGVPLRLVVFDTYNAATPGASEIDSEVVSKIRGQFDYIRAEMSVTTLIVGHTNAVGKHRGNEQLSNNIDTIIDVRRKVKTISARETIPLKDEDGRAIRTMRVRKQREGQDGDETDFVLAVVPDGTVNEYGKPRTSCVVTAPTMSDVYDGERPDDKQGDSGGVGVKVPKQTQMFMECVLKAMEDRGVPPPAELGLPRSVKRVVDYEYVKRLMSHRMLDDSNDKSEAGMQKHRNTAKAANKRARETLMHLQVLGAQSPFIWWTGKPVRGVRASQPNKQPELFEHGEEFVEDIAQGFT